MEIDGLILRLTYDFLKKLESYGLESSNIRVKLLTRDSEISTTSFVSYENLNEFFDNWKFILENKNFLCFVGKFPIVQNIQLKNKNLKFDNSFEWFNIIDDPYFTKTIDYDQKRNQIRLRNINRYISLVKSLINEYKENVESLMFIRMDSYADPCYVDGGYFELKKL